MSEAASRREGSGGAAGPWHDRSFTDLPESHWPGWHSARQRGTSSVQISGVTYRLTGQQSGGHEFAWRQESGWGILTIVSNQCVGSTVATKSTVYQLFSLMTS